ncbi:hypothetical protein WN55_08612 [Dufourea novaeangliae]|uniref:Uncharacterized protein n=1 Tax=Dufourea novaeangliae TaxID=178035 RepID=A0A154PUL9_DUFNO|nr:hypothetical protein WN55_08612 [Dufourea novaeangliae]
MEMVVERAEREMRRKTIIIRGLRMEGEGKEWIKEGTVKLLGDIAVKVQVNDVRALSKDSEAEWETREGKMVWMEYMKIWVEGKCRVWDKWQEVYRGNGGEKVEGEEG